MNVFWVVSLTKVELNLELRGVKQFVLVHVFGSALVHIRFVFGELIKDLF